MKLLLTLLTPTFIAACAASITQEEIASASFGSEPQREEYMAFIEDYFQEIALDPQSVILNCIDAAMGWGRRSAFDRPTFGWVVACNVNGRNRLGGYTGNRPYAFIFNDGQTLRLGPSDLDTAIAQKVGLIE